MQEDIFSDKPFIMLVDTYMTWNEKNISWLSLYYFCGLNVSIKIMRLKNQIQAHSWILKKSFLVCIQSIQIGIVPDNILRLKKKIL